MASVKLGMFSVTVSNWLTTCFGRNGPPLYNKPYQNVLRRITETEVLGV
jgi:hypothetical protein